MQITEEVIGALAVSQTALLNTIAGEVAAVVELTAEDCTVPFISRYRKERTGNLDEVQVRDVVHRHSALQNLETRRIEVIQAIFGQGKLTEELFANINKCSTLTEIEDIYAPYKRKKKTRGMMAMERGLEGLAELVLTVNGEAVRVKAPEYVKTNAEQPELTVASPEEAISGAMDIIAERISQDPENRAAVKKYFLQSGTLKVVGVGDEKKQESSTYQMYWDYAEPLATLKPHRVLAINRGEREGELNVNLEIDEAGAIARLQDRYTLHNDFHREAVADSVERLLAPAVLREIRSDATESADDHGISVFGENLKNLLMSAPIKGTRVLGIDPGIRTGSKCAAIDETGKFLGYFVINQEMKPEEGKKAVAKAIKDYRLELVAIGNGTACQDVAKLVAATIADHQLDVKFTLVDEDGASVYSASDIAREEFPELDLTIRGAISIGRRLQDPLAELVKIDPKSIGVGLYQHDVNQKRLGESVDEVVESVVNRVGVNLNTASHSLLKYVSGINNSLAKKIVKYRDEHGTILSRDALRKISGLGEKTYEQCAGFLKIMESPNPLDRTWVHPEHYPLASEILPVIQTGGELLHEQRKLLKDKYSVGDTTIEDIVLELKKPNRDPREDLPKPLLQQGVISFEDLREGMKVRGKIKNVVDFGAFVDIGIKESALIHVSELSDHFISEAMDVVKVGDVKEFRIISLDPVRRRIGLSLKSENGRPGGRTASGQGDNAARKVVEVKKPGTAQTGQTASGVTTASTAYSGPASGYGNRASALVGRRSDPASGGRGGGRPEKDDDGTSYNPFADLLKNRK